MDDIFAQDPPASALGNLDEEQARSLIAQGVPVIDIRRPQEWALTGVIAGSHLLTFFDDHNEYDLGVWLTEFEKVARKDRPFILVCRMGVRTEVLGRYLGGSLGFGQVHHLQHGINSWIGHGYPVEPVSS